MTALSGGVDGDTKQPAALCPTTSTLEPTHRTIMLSAENPRGQRCPSIGDFKGLRATLARR